MSLNLHSCLIFIFQFLHFLFQVAYAADQCVKQLADHLPLLGVVQVSSDLFLSEDNPKNIRAATFLIQVVHKSDRFVIEESLADVLPSIVQVNIRLHVVFRLEFLFVSLLCFFILFFSSLPQLFLFLFSSPGIQFFSRTKCAQGVHDVPRGHTIQDQSSDGGAVHRQFVR